jgi:hypothetical protein
MSDKTTKMAVPVPTKAAKKAADKKAVGKAAFEQTKKDRKRRKGLSPAQRRAQGRQAAQKKRKTNCMKRLKQR